ncbi:uncharacterized protein TrAtP1_002828 [Trichoderma atroviride]|nr:hypothetical protein TrAtP1_002828 [Trichoderma atroviride]
MLHKADIVVTFFPRGTLSLISLLQFGLTAQTGQAIVYAQDGYPKGGYLNAVRGIYATKIVTSEEDLKNAVIEKMEKLLAERNAS